MVQSPGPVIAHPDVLPVPEGWEEAYRALVERFENGGRQADGANHNEPHAVLKEAFVVGAGMRVSCWETDFAMSRLYRETLGVEFELITGNALVDCPDTDEIIVQLRSAKSHLYPGYLSIFGGGYLPRAMSDKPPDRGNIYHCLRREFAEETGHMSLLDDFDAPLLVLKELSGNDGQASGSISFNALGMTLSEAGLRKLGESWEGSVRRIAVSDIRRSLKDDKWVPFARVVVEVWLEMNRESKSLYGRSLHGLDSVEMGHILGYARKFLDILR